MPESVLAGPAKLGWGRWPLAALLGVIMLFAAREALQGDAARMPPVMLLLILAGPSATLLLSVAAGNVAFALALATLTGFAVTHPAASVAESALRWNLLGVMVTSQVFVFGYTSTFRRLRRRIAEQQARIEQRLHERAALTSAVSADLNRAVARIGEVLAPHAPSGVPRAPELSALGSAQRELEGVMERARNTLHFRKEPDLEATDVLPDFRRRVTRWLLAVSLFNIVLLMLRVVITGSGPLTPTLVAFTINAGVWLGVELLPARRPMLIALLTAVAFVMIHASFFYWGFSEPPPNVVLLATLPFNAFLISGGTGLAAGFVVGSLVAQGAIAAAGASAWSAWATSIALSIACVTVVLQLCWFALERRAAAIFQAAQERAAELKQLDAFRARICGTLFHDVANFVQVNGMIVQLAEARSALDAQQAEMLRGFHQRLAALVAAALEVLEHGELESAQDVVRAPLEPMFEELRALFQYRLSQKAQTLHAESEAQLAVLTVPVLLRDSILANLISNAIKFSPQGTTIELRAQRDGREAQISVRDRGTGFPSDLMPRLTAKERVSSTAGTAGEQGLGLGLTLAAEHLRRMGGSLGLRNHAQGGGEAIVRAPLA